LQLVQSQVSVMHVYLYTRQLLIACTTTLVKWKGNAFKPPVLSCLSALCQLTPVPAVQ